MHSPLPDSSALEAGIIEDDRPSRLSRVQDNVRNLLRASVFSSDRASTMASPRHHQPTAEDDDIRSPMQSPLQRHVYMDPEMLPSPSSQTTTTTHTSTMETDHVPAGILFPPTIYQQQVQEMAHQSTMFNTRAVAALTHPDLSDPSMAVFLQHKTESRQRRAWKRSRNRKLRHAESGRRSSQGVLCVVAGLLLGAIVATYIALATTSRNMSPTFHILFILGILLALIVFAHALVRTCFFKRSVPESPRIYVVSHGRLKRRHHRRRHEHQHHTHPQPREMPALSEATAADFVPPTPIPVHVTSDEVRPDSREAQPTAAASHASQVWDKEVDTLPNPPPAYGRWRGSVRANPDLLHWQAIPSPMDSLDMPDLPSPTYEEAMSAEERTGTGPPSYVTRVSPARRRDVQDVERGLAQAWAVEPEMVEGRGIGIAE